MTKIALIECVKMPKTALIECYAFQIYTTVSNTDLYLSYNFWTTYYIVQTSFSAIVFPGHNDNVERGLTVVASFNPRY